MNTISASTTGNSSSSDFDRSDSSYARTRDAETPSALHVMDGIDPVAGGTHYGTSASSEAATSTRANEMDSADQEALQQLQRQQLTEAQTLEAISNFFKSLHDLAASIIQGVH
jgi:hypothetical protein